jgi:hypothetical protein
MTHPDDNAQTEAVQAHVVMTKAQATHRPETIAPKSPASAAPVGNAVSHQFDVHAPTDHSFDVVTDPVVEPEAKPVPKRGRPFKVKVLDA